MRGSEDYKNANEKYINTVEYINKQAEEETFTIPDDAELYLTEGTQYNKATALKEALRQYNEVLCGIDAEEKIATSNILVLLRSDYADIQDALKGNGIELTAADDGTYFIYNGTTGLIDKELKKTKTFCITAKLTGAAKWKAGRTLRWKIPKNGTMIAAPDPR
jgi:hypothetical protein